MTVNGTGIHVPGCGNLIVRNSASGNGEDYDVENPPNCNSAGGRPNRFGPETGNPSSAGPWDNFAF